MMKLALRDSMMAASSAWRIGAACARASFLAMGFLFLPSGVMAVPAPAGTVISNTASSTQLVAAAPQTTNSNSVQVTVGAVPGLTPALSKFFGAPSINFGGRTTLIFRLTNSAGNPAQAGIAFTDTLPAGLQIAAVPVTTFSAGCAATVNFGPPSTISVTGASMIAGATSCDIIVDGITSVAAANADCSMNPPAFTNGPAAISGLLNASNAVTNQCLVIAPVLTATANPICVRDTPYVDYNVTPLGVGAPGGVKITWIKTTGEIVRVLTGQPLTGRLLWPGAALDAAGNPIAWPGWTFIDNEWYPTDDGLRPDMRILFEVNPSTQLTVSYPPATPACFAGPRDTTTTPDMTVMKSQSDFKGPSPSSPYTITLRYGNASGLNSTKNNVLIQDLLPAGMRYVAGSLRLMSIPASVVTPLTSPSGTISIPGLSGNYETTPDAVRVTFNQLQPNDTGLILFDVSIDAGLDVDKLLKNTATFKYTRPNGYEVSTRNSNTTTFLITGHEAVTLRGMTIPSAEPGSTVTFENLLTNNTGRTDTFDITLSNSNYPAGTILKLFKPDGVTPLADSNSNGVADTGPVAAGGTFKIIVKAELPNGAAGGPYTVMKSARSISNPLVSANANDIVSTIANLCRVTLDPSNIGRVSPGGSIVYTHVVTNVGNCTEQISFPAGLFDNSLAGWVALVVIDNPVAGGQSIVGAFDPQDTIAAGAPSISLPPGGRLILLARVTAPIGAAPGTTNTTTLRINAGSSGLLSVTDRTTVIASGGPLVGDEITGYVDPTFNRPSVWGFIGRPLYLRAMAPSCNANPAVVERRTIIITGPNGEREEIIATETGPDTGIFTADGMMIRLPPVMAGDMILEGRPYDTFQIELTGCGRRISTTVTLIDPSGVVFDSRTNQPISGAVVRLVTASGGQCTSTPAMVSDLLAGQIVPAPSTVTTGADGRYSFPLVSPGDYCVLVTAPNGFTWVSKVAVNDLPQGRNIVATGPVTGGSYGGAFRVGPDTGPVLVDIPVDGGLIGGLFIQKTAARGVVELGEQLDYSIALSNRTGYALDRADVLMTDNLPPGFTYVRGSARRDGAAIADPQGGAGPRLTFNLGRMSRDQKIVVTYRVRVGPGAMQGDGVNRVVASYRLSAGDTLYSESNVATAKVQVTGGVFSDRGYLVGMVFATCANDSTRDGEGRPLGIPGVRAVLEDGTSAISDAEGKFSFYGLQARTHVIKIDRTTLPEGLSGADFVSTGNRNLGRGDSRIVDMKSGELQKTNFEVSACGTAGARIREDIQRRRAAAASLSKEIDGRLQQRLEADPASRPATDIKALPASGIVGNTAPVANVAATPSLGASVEAGAKPDIGIGNGASTQSPHFDSLAGQIPKALPSSSAPAGKAGVESIALENLLPDLDNKLAFVDMKDGEILPRTQSTVRVKGTAGSTFKLTVNGKTIGEDRVGKKAVLAEKGTQAWEYIGVDFRIGENVLNVAQVDQFGNARGEQTIRVRAPGALANIRVNIVPGPKGDAIADGKTPVKIAVKLFDRQDIPVTSRVAVTLESSEGRWDVEDLSSGEPGVQTVVENGVAEFSLLPPTDPSQAIVRVSSGELRAEAKVDFLPDLRDLIAAGVIEGVLNLRKLDAKGISPVRAQDAFEQEITHLSRTWSNGDKQAGARAAMFLKGKVKGEYLLTMFYDSDKNTRDRLFRDIQPDEFYPVYGDSSVRAFDAQSTGRFYVKVDHRKSYLLYGDFNTSQASEARKLANYSRSLTGAKQHYESARVSANAFASRDTARQVIDEIPTNGTSGPFVLSRPQGLINSEKIEVLTRDRNQPAVVLRTQSLARFADYEIEPLTGRILLKAPLPSLDENLNPISLRITYEIDQGGDAFWVTGADVQFKASEPLEIGGVTVDDRNPLDRFRMAGINAVARLAPKTFLIAEVARTQREKVADGLSQGERSGSAQRFELKHASGDLDAAFYAGRANRDFDNPSSSLSSGREELGGRLSYRIDDKTRVRGELLRTEESTSGARRDGLLLALERTLTESIRVEAGVRHARDTQVTNAAGGVAIPQEVTAIRAKVTGDVPGLKGASAFLEAEVDVNDTQRKIAAIGGDFKLGESGRLYARHEFISSLTGPYGLNTQQRQNATVVGVNTDYMKDGNLFSEYRIRDAISGGDAEAAIGLRNMWTLGEGLRLHTGFERVHALSGAGNSESKALTLGLEYTANPIWKGSTKLEIRDGKTSDSILATVAAAAKLSRDWTLLGRNTYSVIKNKGAATGEIEQERLQLGAAYRDTDSDVWNGLGRVEHRIENDDTQPAVKLKRTVDLVSVHANWQPRRPFTFSGRYAAKWVNDRSNNVSTNSRTQLLGGRAIWEFAPRWDASVNASTLFGQGGKSKSYSVGVELGFMVMENLWLSAGYNFSGYRDDDLTAGETTTKGMYLRLRYKFDEDLFGGKPTKSEAVTKAAGKENAATTSTPAQSGGN